MVDTQPPSRSTLPVASAHGAQLKRGFPWLRFERPLEEEFRQAFRVESLPSVRRNLWIAVIFVIGFSWLTHIVLAPNVNRLLDVIRFIVFTPLLALGLLLVHSRWYHRFYPVASVAMAPIFGVGVTVLAVIAATHGVGLIATVVLVTIYLYFMLGMLFYHALTGALLIFGSYLVLARAFGLSQAEMLVDSGVLVFTNLIGAMVCHTLERANRTNFLEEHLLTEMASRDGLTGINNRRVFDDQMRSARRPLDVVARYGGEEFAIVLHDTRRDHIEEIARDIQSGIERLAIEHLASPLPEKRVTVSIGAACVEPVSGRSHYGFIQLADEALYAAKERGRNRAVIMDKEYARLTTGSFRRSANG